MNKNLIFNIVALIILILGIISIILTTMNLIKLDSLKLNGKTCIIKDTEEFIKYNRRLYLFFGVMCSIISLLLLFKIINNTIFCVCISFIVIIVSLINSKSISKYI